MLINTQNFDLDERVRAAVFPDRDGWTVAEIGAGSLAEFYGAVEPRFLIFVEIYDFNKKLVVNYPVECCARGELEEAMKKQIAFYARLLENVVVCAAALASTSIAAHEWAAYESFRAPEELIAEALRRAEEETLKANKDNDMFSYIDFLAPPPGRIERQPPARPRLKIPASGETQTACEIIAFPVLLGACSVAPPTPPVGCAEEKKQNLKS